MAETSQFGLPLLSNAQAQKSVTVNEALCVIDAVAQLRIESATLTQPPQTFVEGQCYAVPNGALDDWLGADGKLAISCNGGWRFITPKVGWRTFNVETGTHQLFDGVAWLESTIAATVSGAATEYEIVEIDHVLGAAPVSQTGAIIPQNAQVIGVTGRVIQPITGSLTSWQLGVAGSPDRYGSGLGLGLNSYALGLSGAPTTYYADTALDLTAAGGDFAAGTIRLAVHLTKLVPPRPV